MISYPVKPSEMLAEQAFKDGLRHHDDGDLEKAIICYEAAANLGCSIAKISLGNIFDDDLNPPNHDRAVYWYTQALLDRESSAAWNLSVHYRNIGDWQEQRRWLRVAAEMKHPDAIVELRKMDGLI